MNFKRLLCKIFGHKLRDAEMYESVKYVISTNYPTAKRRTVRKKRKKKVVLVYRKCRRCGAMIMVSKRNKY